MEILFEWCITCRIFNKKHFFSNFQGSPTKRGRFLKSCKGETRAKIFGGSWDLIEASCKVSACTYFFPENDSFWASAIGLLYLNKLFKWTDEVLRNEVRVFAKKSGFMLNWNQSKVCKVDFPLKASSIPHPYQ